jgi:hypothetical protein
MNTITNFVKTVFVPRDKTERMTSNEELELALAVSRADAAEKAASNAAAVNRAYRDNMARAYAASLESHTANSTVEDSQEYNDVIARTTELSIQEYKKQQQQKQQQAGIARLRDQAEFENAWQSVQPAQPSVRPKVPTSRSPSRSPIRFVNEPISQWELKTDAGKASLAAKQAKQAKKRDPAAELKLIHKTSKISAATKKIRDVRTLGAQIQDAQANSRDLTYDEQRKLKQIEDDEVLAKELQKSYSHNITNPLNPDEFIPLWNSGGGSCLYKSIAQALQRYDEDAWKDVRTDIFNFIQDNPDRFDTLLTEVDVPERDIPEYVYNQKSDETRWGTDLEIYAATCVFFATFYIFVIEGDTGRWRKYESATFGWQDQCPSSISHFLLNTNNQHFECLVPQTPYPELYTGLD